MKTLNLIAIDDEVEFLDELASQFQDGYVFRKALRVPEALSQIAQQRPDLILLDVNMPQVSGLDILKILKRRDPSLPIIMLTGETDPDLIVECIQAGANDYVVKGSSDFLIALQHRIRRLQAISNLSQEFSKLEEQLREERNKFEILGVSEATIKLKAEISKCTGSKAYVLIYGENGTGKELVARTLNKQEGSGSRPFVAVNCGAISPSLFESELFGHVKGSFTGAMFDRDGKFVEAHKGDLFLDEIGDLPIESQVKLLRVLQEKCVTPVGSNKTRNVDIRVIAATNKNLEDLVGAGKFREDLYFRLNQIVLKSRPLRERPDDILFYAQTFAQKMIPEIDFTESAIDCLKSHSWPGNVRELSNTIERACLMIRGTKQYKIRPENITFSTLASSQGILLPKDLVPVCRNQVTAINFEACSNWAQKLFIEKSLELFRNDNSAVIDKLGISKATYYRLKKEFGISNTPKIGIV